MGLLPRQKQRPNPIKQGIEHASATVMSQIWEEIRFGAADPFSVPIGKKPPGIPTPDFLQAVGMEAKRKLMHLPLGNVVVGEIVDFNPLASEKESKRTPKYSGYGNTAVPVFDLNNLHIVFERAGVQLQAEQALPEQQDIQQAA